MARFSSIAKGTLARDPVTMSTIYGVEFSCAVRPLNGEDDALVLQRAREHAQARGVTEPKEGEPLYEQGKWIHTILLGCVDSESPLDAPEPFFADASEVMANLDRDRMAMLCAKQAKVQDRVGLGPSKMDLGDFIAATLQMANAGEEDLLPFEDWRPSMQRAYLRTIAAQYTSFVEHRSLSTSDSSTTPAPPPAN